MVVQYMVVWYTPNVIHQHSPKVVPKCSSIAIAPKVPEMKLKVSPASAWDFCKVFPVQPGWFPPHPSN